MPRFSGSLCICIVNGEENPFPAIRDAAYRKPVGGGSSHAHRQHAQKLVNRAYRACGSGDIVADTQTDGPTDRQTQTDRQTDRHRPTHHNTSQPLQRAKAKSSGIERVQPLADISRSRYVVIVTKSVQRLRIRSIVHNWRAGHAVQVDLGRPRPRLRCVRWGPSSPKRGRASPNFRPMSVVARRLAAGWIVQATLVQDATSYGGTPLPRSRCVSFPSKWAQELPHFRLMSIVGRGQTVAHLSNC